MPAPKIDYSRIGKERGKPDIERLGIFIENPYLNGQGYVSPFPKANLFKGRNMLSDGRKSKCGTQHGYFQTEFQRLYEGEPWKKQRDKKLKKEALPFFPTGPGKWHATPGDYYGCFSGNIEAFSNVRNPKQKFQKEKGNFVSSPLKQGGPGYADICINKYPTHVPDPFMPRLKVKPVANKARGNTQPLVTCHYPQPYFCNNPYLDPQGKIGPTYISPKGKLNKSRGIFMPTGPGKWPGGSHQGCFNPFPEWQPPIRGPVRKKGPSKYFYPQSYGVKSMFTCSVVNAYTDFKVSAKNCNTYQPNFTKHLLD